MISFLSGIDPKKLRGTALLRLDFNTEDDWRMKAAIPTIKFLLRRAAKVVIVSHRGRPDGYEKKFSLKKNAPLLARYLGRKVAFFPVLDLPKIRTKIALAPKGSVFLLENLRFDKGEEGNDPKFAKRLASLADFYVNDAFAVSHRANASVVGITKYLPSYAGLELEDEIRSLSPVLSHPRKPLVFVLGGGKAEDKLGVIKYFRRKADAFLIGGAGANTLLFLKGVDVKRSLRDRNPKDLRELKQVLGYQNIFIPIDTKFYKNAIVDFGPKTLAAYQKQIMRARTIIWSGPVGFIEMKKYSWGTLELGRAIARNRKAFSVAGGGETVMFLKKHNLDKKFSFISTGGGAMVDFLAGKKLPGLEALR